VNILCLEEEDDEVERAPANEKDIEQLLADAENSGITQLDSNRFIVFESIVFSNLTQFCLVLSSCY
jgi:hypothetical protein